MKKSSAFPHGIEGHGDQLGLSKKEYFAIKALQALLMRDDMFKSTRSEVIKMAIEYADIMIKEIDSD